MAGLTFVIIVVVNIPVYLLLGRTFFGSWADFLSLNFGEQRVTFFIYLVSCIAITAAEHHVVAKYILHMDDPWVWLK